MYPLKPRKRNRIIQTAQALLAIVVATAGVILLLRYITPLLTQETTTSLEAATTTTLGKEWLVSSTTEPTTTTTTAPTTTTTTLPEVVTNPPWRWAGNPDKVWGYLGEETLTQAQGAPVDQTQSYWGGIYLGIEEEAPVTIVGKEVEVWVASFAFPNPNGGEDIIGRFAMGLGASNTQPVRFMANRIFGTDPNAYPGYTGDVRIASSEIGQYLEEGDLYFLIGLQDIDIPEKRSEDKCVSSPICSAVRYTDELKRKLQGEDVELPEDGFALTLGVSLSPDQSEDWPPGKSPTG